MNIFSLLNFFLHCLNNKDLIHVDEFYIKFIRDLWEEKKLRRNSKELSDKYLFIRKVLRQTVQISYPRNKRKQDLKAIYWLLQQIVK